MIHLILAGGKAKRLHNKLLMSMLDGRPVICSAIDRFLEVGVSPILCVNEDMLDPLRYILGGLYFTHEFRYFVDHFDGIVPVLNSFLERDDITVLCGDNIYPKGVVMPCLLGQAAVSLLQVTEDIGRELDWYDYASGLWRYRTEDYTDGSQGVKPRLITPWVIPKGVVEPPPANLLSLLNAKDIKPKQVDSRGWYDIGTVQGLSSYYASCKD